MKYVDPPFDMGESLSGTDADGNIINAQWEGAVFEFPDVDRTPALRGGKSRRSGSVVRCVCVRNTSGGNLVIAKKVIIFDITPIETSTSQQLFGLASGQGGAVNQLGGVGDNDFTGLASVGVATNDLFWLIIGGPCLCSIKSSETPIVGELLTASGTAGALITATFGSDEIGMNSAASSIARATVAETVGANNPATQVHVISGGNCGL